MKLRLLLGGLVCVLALLTSSNLSWGYISTLHQVDPSGEPNTSVDTNKNANSLPPINSTTNSSSAEIPLPLPLLVKSEDAQQLKCPESTVVIHDIVHDEITGPLQYKIPTMIHQTSRSRCLASAFNDYADRWKSFGFSYYLHDDQAMGRLMHAYSSEFPHLPLVWDNCATIGALKADLWRLLVLFQYGGIFSDLDSAPNTFSPQYIRSDDEAIFVIDTDGLVGFHFIAVKPKHPIIRLTLHVAIHNLMWAQSYQNVNPVAVTGPSALRSGITGFLHQTSDQYRRSINYTEGKKFAAGEFVGLGGAKLRILDGNDPSVGYQENKNYWVIREMPQKVNHYSVMNMSHFLMENKRQSTGSCFAAMFNDLNRTPLTSKSVGAVLATDFCAGQNVNISSSLLSFERTLLHLDSLGQTTTVPLVVHQMSSECISGYALAVQRDWNDRGFDFYLHTEESMNRLVRSTTTFPHLRLIWPNASNPTRLLLWRLLVLWEYGGIYSKFGVVPEQLVSEHVTRNQFLVISKTNGTKFLASAPKHPLVFYTLQTSILCCILNRPEEVEGALGQSIGVFLKIKQRRMAKVGQYTMFDVQNTFRVLGRSRWVMLRPIV